MNIREELEKLEAEVAALEKRRAELYRASLEAPEDQKLCIDALARMISEDSEDTPEPPQRPEMLVRRMVWVEADDQAVLGGRQAPALVKVRIAGEPKTYLGVYIGHLPSGASCTFNKETGILHIGLGHGNPAIVIPSLRRIVMGYESWWGPIKTEADLKEISDCDIENLPYVKALRELLT